MNHDPVDGLPDGPIYRESDNAQGFLVPTETPNLFDFLIHPTIPQVKLSGWFLATIFLTLCTERSDLWLLHRSAVLRRKLRRLATVVR